MKAYTRTEYSAKNTYIAVISRMAAILMGFVIRVVFTHTLSENYVGVNGLFTDILNVLSLSELGIETAISYALYKPIAENNKEEQKSLMRIYCWYYRAVTAFIVIVGLALIPFMDVIIKNRPDVDNLTLIYLLYLLNSVFSYMLIYKKTLIDAHQMVYIGILYQTISWIIQDILQIIVLIYTKNFILFLLIYIFCTLGGNLSISRKANKLYPFLKEKNIKPLDRQKKKDIFKNIRAMCMHKIGNVALNNTDNLILSSFVGIASVGYYSNYFLIIKSINQILNQLFQGITASIGNLGATQEAGRVKRIYETTSFISQWVHGFAAICLYELINPFVEFSFGKNYLFTKDIVLILCINFFIVGMKDATLVFRDSLGLFWFDRYISLIEAGINLVASIILVKQYGTIGVFLGTMISMMLTSVWLEPYLLYKNYLKASCSSYFLHFLWYTVSIGVIWKLTDFLCHLTTGNDLIIFIKRLMICIVVPNVIMIGLYFKTKEFKFILEKASSIRQSRKENNSKKKYSSERKVKPSSHDRNLEKNTKRHVPGLLRRFRMPQHSIAGGGMKEALSVEQVYLLNIIKKSLNENKKEFLPAQQKLTGQQWNIIFNTAKNHAVLPLLYDAIKEEESIPEDLFENVQNMSRQTALQSYKLLYLTNYVVKLLEREKISVLILKGVSTASLYPVPELRKSGDIDLLVAKREDFTKACEVLEKHNFVVKEKQNANHHVAFESQEKIMIEIHSMLAEPFDNQRVNDYLENLAIEYHSHRTLKDILGSKLPVPEDAYHAFSLLIHMLQHFLRSGFGLKLLCDWVVFWNRDVAMKDQEIFLQLVRDCGLFDFVVRITGVCIHFLGLEEERVHFMMSEIISEEELRELMAEIIEAEEFGKSGNDRMVVLRGTSLPDYVREFHHQMCLNYPNARKIIIIWPVLWINTLVRFLYNNHKIRKTSFLAILRKAKTRSKNKKAMNLFHMK